MGYFEGWFDADGDSGDTTAPTITKITPASFDPVYSVARVEPVVVDITDASPGLALISVITGSSVIYFGTPTGAYGSSYLTTSTITAISNGYRLSILPIAGWSAGALTIVVTAMDGDGNASSLTISLTVPAAAADTEDASPQDFRDSVWRWRRRLRRQKCSVISVAIDDNYSNGPGFVLTALSLELGKKRGLDRVPWRAGTTINTHGSSDIGNGR